MNWFRKKAAEPKPHADAPKYMIRRASEHHWSVLELTEGGDEWYYNYAFPSAANLMSEDAAMSVIRYLVSGKDPSVSWHFGEPYLGDVVKYFDALGTEVSPPAPKGDRQ